MNEGLTRGELFAGATRTGAVLMLAGTGLGALAESANAAPPTGSVGALAAGDLAYVRLLIGVELLVSDFYTQALASKHLRGAAQSYANLALTQEGEHYSYLAFALTSAGGTPLTAADVDFTYRTGTFYTAFSVAATGISLELLALGAYLGAAGNISSPVLAQAVGQITANEAQHLSAVRRLANEPAFHDAFPQAMTIAEASNALDSYAS